MSATPLRTWMLANMPAGAYLGNDPYGSPLDAFCDPAVDPNTGDLYFFGGGHGDGSINAVVKRHAATMGFEMMFAPTPPSCYVAAYMKAPGDPGYSPPPLRYPSGLQINPVLSTDPTDGFGYWLTAAQDADSADAALMAPALARISSHMYSAAVYCKKKVYYLYNIFGVFDLATKAWDAAARPLGLGTLVNAFTPSAGLGSSYGNGSMDWGTVGIYDEQTDRIFFTLVGGGYRNSIVRFNPNTYQVEAIYDSPFGIENACTMTQVGRVLYLFQHPGRNSSSYGTSGVTMDIGQTFNLDTAAFKAFATTGVSAGTFSWGVTQDTIPAWTDGHPRVLRWNHAAAEIGNVYEVDVSAPAAGSGTGATSGDPILYTQRRYTPTGTPPANPKLNYDKRTGLVPNAGASVFTASSTERPVALKIPYPVP